MNYVLIVNDAVADYPYSLKKLRLAYPDTSFPEAPTDALLAGFGVYPVALGTQPTFNAATEKVVETGPVNLAGVWTMTYAVEPLSQDKILALQKEAEFQADQAALRLDADVLGLLKARPAGIENYIETNVNNIAQAKAVLKTIAKAVAVLANHQFR
jgi:hypothetical protein